jgi:hypothetical protein
VIGIARVLMKRRSCAPLILLWSTSPQLAAILKANNDSLSVLPPAVDKRAVAVTSAATLLGFVKVRVYLGARVCDGVCRIATSTQPLPLVLCVYAV